MNKKKSVWGDMTPSPPPPVSTPLIGFHYTSSIICLHQNNYIVFYLFIHNYFNITILNKFSGGNISIHINICSI